MSGQVDVFKSFVRHQLDRWGREFALHQDCEYLGHASKNMLQILIEHKGEMPARCVGFKPLEVDRDAHQIELIVTELGKQDRIAASVLRAMYCGRGRRGVERLEIARELARKRLSRTQYYAIHDDGFRFVRERLCDLAELAA